MCLCRDVFFSCVMVWGGTVLGSWATYCGLEFWVLCCCGGVIEGVLGVCWVGALGQSPSGFELGGSLVRGSFSVDDVLSFMSSEVGISRSVGAVWRGFDSEVVWFRFRGVCVIVSSCLICARCGSNRPVRVCLRSIRGCVLLLGCGLK